MLKIVRRQHDLGSRDEEATIAISVNNVVVWSGPMPDWSLAVANTEREYDPPEPDQQESAA